jgi:hypothetical protein
MPAARARVVAVTAVGLLSLMAIPSPAHLGAAPGVGSPNAAATASSDASSDAARATSSAAKRRPAQLGVSYGGWKGQYSDAAKRVAQFKEIGFQVVSFVPTYGYVGRNKIDLASGPDPSELGEAVEIALRSGLGVVVKPHLDPPAYGPGFDPFRSDNPSWRVNCPWRGFFDLDPISDDYRDGIVFRSLQALKSALDHLGNTATLPVRLELGVELMDSEVDNPERWELLLAAAKKERHRLGLDGRVLLSHDVTHHIEILDDFVGRMAAPKRAALKRYIRGLDALSLSQYMDLTVAVPQPERGHRLPSADEVMQALVLHEKNFREQILQAALGLREREIPPLHIGEFGIGRGGLKHPNLWSGDATAEQEKELAQEIARGHEGLIRYLALTEGRTADSVILWVTGAHYDIFGWENPRFANPEAVAAIRAGLRRSP